MPSPVRTETIISSGEAVNDELCDWLVLAFYL